MTGTPAEPTGRLEPRIILEKGHPIRLNMIDRDAIYVMRKLNKAGFSSYLVGGGVRDLYLGKTPKDFDISTDARPGQIRKLFRNSSTIGRRFRLVQIFFQSSKVIEVSTLRSLSEHDLDGPEAVLAPNNTFGNLSEDAQRRDLSINSLFYEIEKRTIIDYIGGVEDLDNCVIRIVGVPDKRINRDPVRMIRAVRHSARTGFRIEDATWDSICRNHDKLLLCPPSRIRDELFKDLYGGAAAKWLDLAIDSDLFLTLFPLYRDILHSAQGSSPSCLQQLRALLSQLDSLYCSEGENHPQQLPKYFVLALLMLPWALIRFNLAHIRLKGPAYFQLSKKVRREIDNHLGIQLNLRKSTRQEMVTLLCNLPQFVHFVQSGSHPKWLKKKSYYQRCLLFHDFYQGTTSGQDRKNRTQPFMEKIAMEESHLSSKPQPSKRKTKPAFAPKKKGGVFGFRK